MQGTTPSRSRYHTTAHEKNPEASEYCVLKTLPIILSVMSTWYVLMK